MEICNVCRKEVETVHGYTLSDGAFDLCDECSSFADYLRHQRQLVSSKDILTEWNKIDDKAAPGT